VTVDFSEMSPPYSTIVADPPWQYAGGGPVGAGGAGVNNGATQVAAGDHYSTMTTDEIMAMPVADLAAANAHLYVWTTNSFMEDGHRIARAWGFTPKTILTWAKVHQDDPQRVSMKTGYYFRGATEHVIFAVRGSLPLQTSEGLPTAYLWPRIGAHSVKPDAFGDLVEKASPGPYLELFARSPRLGWDSWGKGYEIADPRVDRRPPGQIRDEEDEAAAEHQQMIEGQR
jgi:N6-adenosine-specific RNA methylase IME4